MGLFQPDERTIVWLSWDLTERGCPCFWVNSNQDAESCEPYDCKIDKIEKDLMLQELRSSQDMPVLAC